jgi:hypothetical protein
VEERLFREHFRHVWIIAAMPTDETTPGCSSLWTKTNESSAQTARHRQSLV